MWISILSITISQVCFAEGNDPCADEAFKVSAKNSACKELDKIDEYSIWNYTQAKIDLLSYKCDLANQKAYDSCYEKRKKKKTEISAKLLGLKINDYQNWRNPIVPIEECRCMSSFFRIEGCNDSGNAKYNGGTSFECDSKTHKCTCSIGRELYVRVNGGDGCSDVIRAFFKMVNSAKKYDQITCEVLSEHLNVVTKGCFDLSYANYLLKANEQWSGLVYDSDNKESQSLFNASLKKYIYNCMSEDDLSKIKIEISAKLLGMSIEKYMRWRAPEVPIEDCDCTKFPIAVEGCNDMGSAKYKNAECECDKQNKCECYTGREEFAKINGQDGCRNVIRAFAKMTDSAKRYDVLTCDVLSNHLNIVSYACFELPYENYEMNIKNHVTPLEYDVRLNSEDLEKVFNTSLEKYKNICQNNE